MLSMIRIGSHKLASSLKRFLTSSGSCLAGDSFLKSFKTIDHGIDEGGVRKN